MNEVIINHGVDPKDTIKCIDGVQYIPKSMYDDVVADRRNIAMDNAKLYKDIEDLKKTMRNKKNEVEKKTDTVRLKPEKLERRIYPNWSFELNGHEKFKINNEIYNELNMKYKISYDYGNEDADVIILIEYQSYCKRYKVVRNRPNLTACEVALLVDNGNLCFGFSGNEIEGKCWLE